MSKNIKELRIQLGDTQAEFAERYKIPFRTVQNWESGLRKPPDYILDMLEKQIESDLINHKTIALPKYNSRKKQLPKRADYIGSISWLKAVQDFLGEDVVFALDDALMCQGLFGGHNDEQYVWVYGGDSLKKFNGVVILGNGISSHDVEEKNGIRYTSFCRTISDSFANEGILDMQGITEAISHFYFLNNESIDGIYVSPEYQKRFRSLVEESISYYTY